MTSPFASAVFQKYTFEFTVYTSILTTDAIGNVRPERGVTPLTLEVTLKQVGGSLRKRLIEQLGADAVELALEGYCTNPTRFPAGIVAGLESPLVLNGSRGVFKLAPTMEPIITVLPSVPR
ncbi:MAG: hypothetical protein HC933_09180 [Pleurocapsa sp. SU_196_0]|nr:hypothetical protein [Pleurocapsa sp. SU_196_0]